jgi:acetylornithine deacetylase/succinyl-diaminopimelate desuccinylase-like protein
MNPLAERLLNAIDAERIRARLFEMVTIPSPTGNARAVAEHYVELLRRIGLTSQLRPLEGRPDSPSVVARWAGSQARPLLQLAGHLDTIHTRHAAPRIEGGRLYGRGSADMKSGLTAIVEVVQIIVESGVPLPGSLLVTAYDLHEHPWGHGEAVRDLAEAGIVGDAVWVAEGPPDEVAVAVKGTTSFEIEISSPAGSPHELHPAPGTTNPFMAAIRLGQRLIEFGEQLEQQTIPLLGTETIFLSSIHGGDFYNRLPGSVVIGGTRRFAPGRSFAAIAAELQAIADAVVAGTELAVRVSLGPMMEGSRQSADSRLVKAVRSAYLVLYGREMPVTGQLFGADNERFANWAHIPAVCIGAGLGQSHADVEYVELEAVVGLARHLLLSALVFFDMV